MIFEKIKVSLPGLWGDFPHSLSFSTQHCGLLEPGTVFCCGHSKPMHLLSASPKVCIPHRGGSSPALLWTDTGRQCGKAGSSEARQYCLRACWLVLLLLRILKSPVAWSKVQYTHVCKYHDETSLYN